jgi:hypothetical protein
MNTKATKQAHLSASVSALGRRTSTVAGSGHRLTRISCGSARLERPAHATVSLALVGGAGAALLIPNGRRRAPSTLRLGESNRLASTGCPGRWHREWIGVGSTQSSVPVSVSSRTPPDRLGDVGSALEIPTRMTQSRFAGADTTSSCTVTMAPAVELLARSRKKPRRGRPGLISLVDAPDRPALSLFRDTCPERAYG